MFNVDDSGPRRPWFISRENSCIFSKNSKDVMINATMTLSKCITRFENKKNKKVKKIMSFSSQNFSSFEQMVEFELDWKIK